MIAEAIWWLSGGRSVEPKGLYAGIPPTGRQLNLEVMVFYPIADGRISRFWMQADSKALVDRLTR
jgi:predicted ester cyclase